jgi:ubiquinone/menaquinone biosynthesis C-methylase UbiE
MKTLVLMLFCCVSAFPQVAAEANKGYQTKEDRAKVAKGLADPARDEKQKPGELVEAMNLQAGMNVADVGTGVGYMLPYLSHAVGPTGKVYAEDIQTDFLDQAKMHARMTNLNNVMFILGTARDPKLPGDTLNAILILDVYHHFDYPDMMLGNMRQSLVSDGRMYIVDYYRSLTSMPNGRALQHIRLDRDEVVKEVEDYGFHLVGKREHIPGVQYMLTFEKK